MHVRARYMDKVMETESKQKTSSRSASSESLYLGRRKPLPVSQDYFRSRDNHFRFDGMAVGPNTF